MNLPNEYGRINFLVGIFSDFSKALTGGVVAMHKLAYLLAERGHNVYIFCHPEYPHERIQQIRVESYESGGYINYHALENFTYPIENTVAIYPQIIRNNPFNTPNVARWILYDTENNVEDDYDENDVYFNFGSFKTTKIVPDRKLTVFNYYFDILKKKNFGKRKPFCHLMHKHTPIGGEEIFKDLKSEDLSAWKSRGCYDYLVEKFNEYEYFLTYDQKSFFPLAAGLCGAKTIILNPDKNLTPTEYRLQNPIQMFGVAYGWDDLSWAEQTINLVPNYLKELERIDNKTVDSFISFWYNKLYQ
jgi:hypothetical protein